RGRMHTDELLTRHGEHVERIVVAQIGLHSEGKTSDVGERFEIGRPHPGLVKGLLVVRHVVIGTFERGLQPLCLQGGERVARHAFDVGLEHSACRPAGRRLRVHALLPHIVLPKTQPGFTPGPAEPAPRTGVCAMAKPWLKPARVTMMSFVSAPAIAMHKPATALRKGAAEANTVAAPSSTSGRSVPPSSSAGECATSTSSDCAGAPARVSADV